MVEDEGRGQPQPGRAVEQIAQLHSGQRVEAELVEGAVGPDVRGAVVAEDGGGVAAHERERRAGAVGLRECVEPHPVRVRRDRGGGAASYGDEAAQQGGNAVGAGPQSGVVHPQRRQVGLPGAQREVEQGEVLGGRQRCEALAADAACRGPVQRRAHARGAAPQSPGQGEGGQPRGTALPGECVERGVRRGVVALPGAVDERCGGGEEDEGGQLQVAGEFVQVPGRVRLGRPYGGHALRGQVAGQGVVEDPGRVHDGGERVLLGNVGQETGERRAVGDVAGGDAHLRAERREL